MVVSVRIAVLQCVARKQCCKETELQGSLVASNIARTSIFYVSSLASTVATSERGVVMQALLQGMTRGMLQGLLQAV